MLLHLLERVSWGWGSQVTHRASRNAHEGEQEAVSIEMYVKKKQVDNTSSIGLSLCVKLFKICDIVAVVRPSRDRPVVYQRLV